MPSYHAPRPSANHLRFRSLDEFVDFATEYGDVPAPVRPCGVPCVFPDVYHDESPELPLDVEHEPDEAVTGEYVRQVERSRS